MQPATHREQPQPNAKVILFTTQGQIEIQIWGREAPLAARNFLQHCLDKYYDNTTFHRLIPAFMVQGGDPTGTGQGGQSIYGQPFKDQPHQRLRFSRRGIVAMANRGKDSNGSQFFITFGQCEHLNKKHTIFGRVVGDTIYNLMGMQSMDCDDNDCPTSPPTIRRTKVVLNPFEDMVARRNAQDAPKVQVKLESPAIKKEEIKKLKKKNKLTFDCDEQFQEGNKIKSSHQVLKDSKLSNEVAVDQQQLAKKVADRAQEQLRRRAFKDRLGQQGETEGGENALAQQEMKKKIKLNEERQPKIEDGILNYKTTFNVQTQRNQITWQQLEKKKEQERQEELKVAHQKFKQQTEGIFADELNFKKVKEGSHLSKRKERLGQEIELLSNAQKMRYSFLKKREQDKSDTNLFQKLNSFTGKLKGIQNKDKNSDWMRHQLKFHIDSQAAYKLDEKKQLLHEGQDDLDDGGLKVEVEYNRPLQKQFNIDQLYDQIHGKDPVE